MGLETSQLDNTHPLIKINACVFSASYAMGMIFLNFNLKGFYILIHLLETLHRGMEHESGGMKATALP